MAATIRNVTRLLIIISRRYLFFFERLLNVVSISPVFHEFFNFRYREYVIFKIVYYFNQFVLYAFTAIFF